MEYEEGKLILQRKLKQGRLKHSQYFKLLGQLKAKYTPQITKEATATVREPDVDNIDEVVEFFGTQLDS